MPQITRRAKNRKEKIRSEALSGMKELEILAKKIMPNKTSGETVISPLKNIGSKIDIVDNVRPNTRKSNARRFVRRSLTATSIRKS